MFRKISIYIPILISLPPFFCNLQKSYKSLTEAYRTLFSSFTSSLSPISSEICLPKVFGNFSEVLWKPRKHIWLDFLLFPLPFHQYQVKYVYPRFSEVFTEALRKPRKPFFNKTWRILISSPPFSLSTPPLGVFYWFLSETLRNLTNYATMLVFLSGILQNFTDYTTMLFLTSKMLRDFTNYITMGVKHFEAVKRRSHANK